MASRAAVRHFAQHDNTKFKLDETSGNASLVVKLPQKITFAQRQAIGELVTDDMITKVTRVGQDGFRCDTKILVKPDKTYQLRHLKRLIEHIMEAIRVVVPEAFVSPQIKGTPSASRRSDSTKRRGPRRQQKHRPRPRPAVSI